MDVRGDFSSIPLVDLEGLSTEGTERELAERVGDICHHVGFALLTNHGVTQASTDEVFAKATAFFNLPLEQKLSIDKRESRHFRGWEPEGAERTNNRPDIREQIDLWTEHPARARDVAPAYLRLLGPNQWPSHALVPGFKATVEAWVEQTSALASQIMRLLAINLELQSSYFEALFGQERMSLTKIIRYPPTPPGQFGVNAHHDAGFLTLLSPGATPGLEVQNAQGDWIPVPVVPGALVLNLGEVLQKMSGNYFVATPHRVVTGAARQSLGYFHGPSLDTRLSSLPLGRRFTDKVAASARHAGAGFMTQRNESEAGVADMASRHHPDIYGDQLWNYFARSYAQNVSRHYGFT